MAASPSSTGIEQLESRALLASTATTTFGVADFMFSQSPAVAPLSVPGVPRGITGVPGDGRVSLTWAAPAWNGGAAIRDYVVQMSSDGGATWTRFTDRVSAATSATVTGLANGSNYVFRVAAVNAAGAGATSDASAGIVPCRVPGRPTGISAVPGNGQVRLAWLAPVSDGGAAITDYVVQLSSNGGATWTPFDDGVSTATSTTVPSLANGTSYVFRVAAVNAVGTGAASTSAATAPRTVPGVPRGITGVPGDGRVSLTWAAPAWNGGAAIRDYVVQMSSDGGATWTTFTDRVSAATSATVTGLANGSNYVFRVAAVNAAGAGAASDASAAIVLCRVPGRPTGISGVPGNGQVSLAWLAPAWDGGGAIRDYVVQLSSNGGATWTPFDDGVSTATSTTVTGLTNGTSYAFRVAAVNAAGTGAASVASAAITPWSPTPPPAPTGVTVASPTDSSVTLSWNDVFGESGYRIERSSDYVEWLGSDYATWTEVGRGAADSTTLTDAGLEEGSRYGYRVIAVNAAGASAPSAIVTADVGLRAPGGVVATVVSGGRIDLSWVDRSSNETHYVVEQFDHSTHEWAPVGEAPVDSSGMTVTGAFAPNTNYQFRVRAVAPWWAYANAFSADVAASVTTPAYPTVPGGLTAIASVDSVRLSWDHRADVAVVVERMNSGGEWSRVAEITSAASSYEDETLETSTAYVYRIAFRNAHGISGFSESVSAVTNAGPNVDAAYRSPSEVFVRWTCPLEGVTGIVIERATIGSDAWTVVAALAGTATGLADTDVVFGTSYRYRIMFERGARPPFIAASTETGAELRDTDGDRLIDGEELAIGTNPRRFSTDSDLLGDGFERSNGLDPLAGDEDGNGVSDQYDDFDGDGLATWQEVVFGTSTSRADVDGDGRPDGADSDGDGVSDGAEVAQGGDPVSSLDRGEPPIPDARIKLRVSVGDPSGSHSEQWALRVGPIMQVSPKYGEVGSGEYFFDVGKSYPITLEHQGSLYEAPDYDWYANIQPIEQWEFFVADDNTPRWIVGPYQGDWMSNSGVNFASLEATLHVPRLDVDVDSGNDGGYAIPDDDPAEDRLENDGTRGKLVFATTGDVDQDGIVDSSDFGGIAGGKFVPMVVRVSSNLAEAHPSAISVSFDHDPTVFRLWKPGCDAATTRTTSDIIPARTWVSADEIGLVPGGSVVVYVEALKGGPLGGVPITTSMQVEAARWNGTLQDTVHLLPVAVDIDVDSNNDGRIAEDDDPIEEQWPGFILFVNSDDDDRNGVTDVFDVGRVEGENDLAEIILAASSPIGSGVGSLIVTYDETIIRLYTLPDRSGGISSGSPIAAETKLYVEGRVIGTSLVTVTLTVGAVHVTDTVTLTVRPYPTTIDVDIDSDNNNLFEFPGRSEWEETLEDHAYGIGKLIMLDNPQRTGTPIVLEIAAGLPKNSPTVGVRIDWDVVGLAGWVRLWNTDEIGARRSPAPVNQAGNQIFPEFVYKLADLNYNPQTGTIMIWAEGIRENDQLKTLAGVEAVPKVDERIRGTLVVNGDDAAFDEVKYIVANEDSFYYALHTRQEVRNALASRGVYTFADMPKFGLQPKSPLDLQRLGVPVDANLRLGEGSGIAGFRAMVYQDYITGKDQYVLAFGGTDDEAILSSVIGGGDWWNNIVQGFGFGAPEQYVAAMEVGFALANIPAIPQGHLIATGHSLGGGLASAAAVVGGIPAHTFNAAWLREETLLESDGIGGSRERYQGSLANLAGAAGTIAAYYIDWDILTFAQRRASNGMSIHPVGTLLERDGPYDEKLSDLDLYYMYELHLMPSVLYGLLVTEGSFGGFKIDMIGYDAYFGN